MVVRLALVLALAACASTEPPVAESAKAAQAPPSPTATPEARPLAEPRGEPITVVGVVHENGIRVCDAQGNETWVDKYYLTGFTPLVLDKTVEAEVAALHRRPVVVRGRVQVPPRSMSLDSVSGAPCPQYQMRSDWVITSEGARSRRDTKAAPGVAVADIRPYEGLDVTDSGDGDVRIELTNTFDLPLTDRQVITVHYEGCFGKPGTRTKVEHRESPLPPGESWSFDAPKIIEDPTGPAGRRVFRLASVQIIAEAEAIAFDLDAALHELGHDGVSCPQGGKKFAG